MNIKFSRTFGSAGWEFVANQVTFQPVLTLRIHGRQTKVELPIEPIIDGLVNENEFMLMLLDQLSDLTPNETADAYSALRQTF